MSRETILITGANGIVGCELARTLSRVDDAPALRLLVRADDDETFEQKARWLMRWIDAPASIHDRIEVVRGDVTEPGLGLSVEERARLEDEVTGVLHSAACTSFSQRAEDGDRANVLGLERTLAFARGCERLERFGLLSTAYVAGRREGSIEERALEDTHTADDPGFCNEYERSKADAERLARAAKIPLAVYRIGVVVGRTDDGRISRMSGAYPVFRIFHRGLMAMLPGDPAQPVDLVPVDFAAAAITHLFRHSFEPGATYHVCAGPARSLTLGELLPRVADALERAAPGFLAKGYPTPAEVDFATFSSFADTVELVAHVSLRATVRQMRLFTAQLDHPKRFSTARLDEGLAGSGITLPHAREWLDAVIGYGVEHDWRAEGWEDALDDTPTSAALAPPARSEASRAG